MNKTALITGGTRGIGLGISRCLADAGWDLALNGVRDESMIRPVLSELRSGGRKVFYAQGNIALTKERNRIIEVVKDQFDQLNLLVNNAGMAPRLRNDVLDTTEDSFEEVLKTNLQGPYFLTQQIARWMIETKSKTHAFSSFIVNISSVSATVASVNRGEYCISKAGISMMTQLYAVRLGAYDIPVYEVRPGIVKTDMTSGVTEKYNKMIADGLCVQPRWGLPEDVGKVVAALARGDFSYSTGQIILVDGGMTLGRL